MKDLRFEWVENVAFLGFLVSMVFALLAGERWAFLVSLLCGGFFGRIYFRYKKDKDYLLQLYLIMLAFAAGYAFILWDWAVVISFFLGVFVVYFIHKEGFVSTEF